MTQKYTDIKWDYRDVLRDMTKNTFSKKKPINYFFINCITELEIIFEEDPPRNIEEQLTKLFLTKNQ